MIKERIKKDLKIAIEKATGEKAQRVKLEHPENPEHGDYSSNFALAKFENIKSQMSNVKNSLELAKKIAENFPKTDYLKKVEAVKPGFINFWLSTDFLLSIASRFARGEIEYPEFHWGQQEKVMIEFAHPNTHKPFHIGHLRNISLGESLARIFEAVGNKVIRANYQGDVGLHIAKCLYGILHTKNYQEKIKELTTLQEKMNFLKKSYIKASKAYEKDQKAQQEITELNHKIYRKDPQIRPLWKKTRQWSLDYFDHIYDRVDTTFDRFYFEGQVFERGLEIARKALEQGILKKSKKAVVFDGQKYGLDTRVFITAAGLPTYEAKELGLAELEFKGFGEIDKCIHVVAPEQTSFFKVTFKVEELLDPQKYKDKQYHLAYGYVHLKRGKMSSRKGILIETNWLLGQIKQRLEKMFKVDEKTLEKIAVGATKYSMLKVDAKKNLVFDIEKSISLEGNSGPYLQYTNVRAKSILAKTGQMNHDSRFMIHELNQEELDLLRMLYRFPEVVKRAAKNYNPSLVCNFLFDLAQKFNLFYEKCPVLKAENEESKKTRLSLVKAFSQVLENGLNLLGIAAPEEM